MRDDLLLYYERELTYMRQLGAQFAEKYPKIASRLVLEPTKCDDPHVERLGEAVLDQDGLELRLGAGAEPASGDQCGGDGSQVRVADHPDHLGAWGWVVERAGTVELSTPRARGSERAGSADLYLDCFDAGGGALGGKFVRDRPPGTPRDKAKPTLQREVVDLIDDAVDIVSEIGALGLDLAVMQEQFLRAMAKLC